MSLLDSTTREIPLDAISPDPTQPRKEFDKAKLDQLTESVRYHGVLEPIMVRPVKVAGQAAPGKFTIIFGERRWRAARAAKLATIPAIVRDQREDEVTALQLEENDNRDDLRALERSNAHQQMKRRGLTNAQIAKETSVSEATVRDSLKLQDLAAPVKKAWAEGRLDYSKALVLARVPGPVQLEVLKEYLGSGVPEDPDELLSVRQLRELVQRDYMLDLKKAPFAIADAQLVAAAGPCTSCPKRTGTQPELFADVKSADVCTDKPCYQKKCDAYLAQQEKAGRTVLSPTKAAEVFHEHGDFLVYEADFVKADEKRYDAKKTYGQQVGPEKVVLAKNPHTGAVVELVPKSAIPKPASSSSTPRTKSADEVRREREAKVRGAAQVKIIDAMSQAKDVELGTDLFLRAVARGVVGSVQLESCHALAKRLGLKSGEKEARPDWRELVWEHLDTLGQGALRRVLLQLAWADKVPTSFWTTGLNDDLVEGAKMLRVDSKKCEALARKEVADELAKKAGKKKPKAKKQGGGAAPGPR